MYDRQTRTRVDLHGRRLVSPRHAGVGCRIIRGSRIVCRLRDGSARTGLGLRRRRLVSLGHDAASGPANSDCPEAGRVDAVCDTGARSGVDLRGSRVVSPGNDTARIAYRAADATCK